MEVDFFKQWELAGSVRLSSRLSGQFAEVNSMLGRHAMVEAFPEGVPDQGCEIERFDLEAFRYALAMDLSKLSLAQRADEAAVLRRLLRLILNPDISHFSVG